MAGAGVSLLIDFNTAHCSPLLTVRHDVQLLQSHATVVFSGRDSTTPRRQGFIERRSRRAAPLLIKSWCIYIRLRCRLSKSVRWACWCYWLPEPATRTMFDVSSANARVGGELTAPFRCLRRRGRRSLTKRLTIAVVTVAERT